jgi:D-serine deaminase-like pyridoxal phosphate-dependent protein
MHYVPAAFIATPVLGARDRTQIRGLEPLAGVMTFDDATSERGFIIHGGHRLANPESPPGVEFDSIFGHLSNQGMLNGSRSIVLGADEQVFFRPAKSEAVLRRFGDLPVYEDGRTTARWPARPISA